MEKKYFQIRRLPAEWEEQDAVLLAWPHRNSDWSELLTEVQQTYLELTRQLTRVSKVIIATPEPKAVEKVLQDHGVAMNAVMIFAVATDDTWARDFGPITVYAGDQPLLLDFGFNGWGLKFAAAADNQITRNLHQAGCFGQTALETIGLILEGGSIESDGNGTLLTTSDCLLNPNRNPHLGREQLAEQLTELFGTAHILWLDHGWLAGDDTDSHIDTLARLCPEDTIVYVRCDDPADEHFPALQSMQEQLRSFTTRAGKPYRLLPLPWPAACFDDGERLPATYANFLVINQLVLVPTYADPADSEALAVVAQAFPGYEIIGIDCRTLIRQHGSLHCITMQIPKGVLK